MIKNILFKEFGYTPYLPKFGLKSQWKWKPVAAPPRVISISVYLHI